MAPKTEAELALLRKYEELRKKKEAKLKAKQQQDAAPKGDAPKQVLAASAAKPSAAPAKPQLPGLTARKPAVPSRALPAAKPAAPAAPQIPGETAKQRAIRLLAAKRAAAGGGGSGSAAQRKPAAAPATGPAAAGAPSGGQPTIPKRQPAVKSSAPAAEAAEPGERVDSPAGRSSGGAAPTALPQQDVRQRAAVGQQVARQQQEQQRPGGGDGSATAAKRPAVKRPTSHRPASRDEDGTAVKRAWPGGSGSGGGAAGWNDALPPQQRFEPREAPGDEADDERRSTLFVGDLPPHYDSEAVQAVFGDIAAVDHARVVGTQCYAFVRFRSPADADFVMQRTREAPPEVENGRQLRINWAHGQLPDWKHGSQLVRERVAPGLEQYEHPKVREARLAAQAAADAFDPEALAEVELRPPPRRALVVYDDL